MRLINADALINDLKYDIELDAKALNDTDLVDSRRELIQFDKDCKQNAIDLLEHAPIVEEINTALTKLVEYCSKCKDCTYNHNNCCFFVISCTNNNFEMQKARIKNV